MRTEKTAAEKQLTWIRIQTLMIALILILVGLCVFVMVSNVAEVMNLVEEFDLEQLNDAVGSLKTAADKLAQVDVHSLNSGIQELADTAEKLSEVDVEQLISFMDSLEEMSAQMDSFSGIFKGIFGK